MKHLSLITILSLALLTTPSVSESAKKKKNKVTKQKLKKGSMAESKKELQMILSSFKDEHGGEIVKIQKISKDRYKVDVKSQNGKRCISHKVKTSGSVPSYDLKVYKCD